MIFILKGADFSASNIGQLNFWNIKISTSGTVSATWTDPKEGSKSANKTSFQVAKNSTNLTITISGLDGVTADDCSTTLGTGSLSGTTYTVTIPTVTGNVNIVAKASSVTPDVPTPTNYTFTLNPTPTSATVTLSATGYSTVSGTGSKSITVANGTKVNWTVSASGYTTRTGNWTANGKDETLPVVLTATGGGGTGGDTSNLLTKNPYFVTTGIPTDATTSSYGTRIGYDYGGFICKGIKSVSTGEGNSFNVYTGTKGSDGYIGNTEKVETFTYTKEKGVEEEFLFISPIDLTGDTRLTCNGSFMWRQSTTEEQNNPPQGVRRLQTNTPLYYYWYIF